MDIYYFITKKDYSNHSRWKAFKARMLPFLQPITPTGPSQEPQLDKSLAWNGPVPEASTPRAQFLFSFSIFLRGLTRKNTKIQISLLFVTFAFISGIKLISSNHFQTRNDSGTVHRTKNEKEAMHCKRSTNHTTAPFRSGFALHHQTLLNAPCTSGFCTRQGLYEEAHFCGRDTNILGFDQRHHHCLTDISWFSVLCGFFYKVLFLFSFSGGYVALFLVWW